MRHQPNMAQDPTHPSHPFSRAGPPSHLPAPPPPPEGGGDDKSGGEDDDSDDSDAEEEREQRRQEWERQEALRLELPRRLLVYGSDDRRVLPSLSAGLFVFEYAWSISSPFLMVKKADAGLNVPCCHGLLASISDSNASVVGNTLRGNTCTDVRIPLSRRLSLRWVHCNALVSSVIESPGKRPSARRVYLVDVPRTGPGYGGSASQPKGLPAKQSLQLRPGEALVQVAWQTLSEPTSGGYHTGNSPPGAAACAAALLTTQRCLIVDERLRVVAAASLAPDLGVPVSCLWVGPALLLSTSCNQVRCAARGRLSWFSACLNARPCQLGVQVLGVAVAAAAVAAAAGAVAAPF